MGNGYAVKYYLKTFLQEKNCMASIINIYEIIFFHYVGENIL